MGPRMSKPAVFRGQARAAIASARRRPAQFVRGAVPKRKLAAPIRKSTSRTVIGDYSTRAWNVELSWPRIIYCNYLWATVVCRPMADCKRPIGSLARTVRVTRILSDRGLLDGQRVFRPLYENVPTGGRRRRAVVKRSVRRRIDLVRIACPWICLGEGASSARALTSRVEPDWLRPCSPSVPSPPLSSPLCPPLPRCFQVCWYTYSNWREDTKWTQSWRASGTCLPIFGPSLNLMRSPHCGRPKTAALLERFAADFDGPIPSGAIDSLTSRPNPFMIK